MPTNRTAGLQLRRGAGTLPARVCWPGSSAAAPPLLLLFLTAADDGSWCRELSASAHLVVLSVTCGRPHPADLHDAVAAAQWAAENTARLGANPGHLLVGGAGPGGTLAAAVALHARADGWPAFTRQVLICAGPVEPAPPSLAGLTPATAVTVEHDPAGDDGRYAAQLRRAGVAVDELRYAAPDAAAAMRIRNGRQLLADLSAALRTHLAATRPDRKKGIHLMTDSGQPPAAHQKASADYQKTIRVKASPGVLFDALTSLAGLSAWWTSATGSGDTGGELKFLFDSPEQPCVMHVDQATRPTSVQWTCTEYSVLPDWAGTRPAFTITPVDVGVSELRFRHYGLTPELDCIEVCTRGWDHFLTSLRDYAETGRGMPFGSSADEARRVQGPDGK